MSVLRHPPRTARGGSDSSDTFPQSPLRGVAYSLLSEHHSDPDPPRATKMADVVEPSRTSLAAVAKPSGGSSLSANCFRADTDAANRPFAQP